MPDDAPIPKMTTLLNSSNVHSVGHDGSALLVRFKGAGGLAGKVYRYPGAGADLVDQIVNAESPGSFLHANVVRRFKGTALDEPAT